MKRSTEILVGLSVVLGLGLVVVAFVVGRRDDLPILGIVCFASGGIAYAATAAWMLIRRAREIRADEDGLRFVSRAGSRFVPWDALTAVSRYGGTLTNGLLWQTTGGNIVTWATYDRQSDLLHLAMSQARNLLSVP